MVTKPALARVNAVLETIEPDWSFAYQRPKGGRIVLVRRFGNVQLAVRLRSCDRLWLAWSRRQYSFGGTVEQALAQLVLWLRDYPRRPLAWWRHCCSEQVGLGSPETLLLLAAGEPGDYDDPARTCCVLCAAKEPNDWWSLGGTIGPCCFGGRCRKKED